MGNLNDAICNRRSIDCAIRNIEGDEKLIQSLKKSIVSTIEDEFEEFGVKAKVCNKFGDYRIIISAKRFPREFFEALDKYDVGYSVKGCFKIVGLEPHIRLRLFIEEE